MRRSWMLGHLAHETKAHHASADGDRLAILERPSLERYRAFLAQIYCFEAPLEAALIATDGFPTGLGRTHLKAQRLAADLEALGYSAREVLPTEPVQFAGPAEALGWLWVVHRNTLVHGLVHRYLHARFPDTIRTAGAYLSAFEGRAGALMRELGDVLDATTRRTATAQRIVTAASEAFRVQHSWYGCDLLTSRRAPAARRRAPSEAA